MVASKRYEGLLCRHWYRIRVDSSSSVYLKTPLKPSGPGDFSSWSFQILDLVSLIIIGFVKNCLLNIEWGCDNVCFVGEQIHFMSVFKYVCRVALCYSFIFAGFVGIFPISLLMSVICFFSYLPNVRLCQSFQKVFQFWLFS